MRQTVMNVPVCVCMRLLNAIPLNQTNGKVSMWYEIHFIEIYCNDSARSTFS